MKSPSTVYMEEIIRRTSAVKMYKRDTQSLRKTLSEDKYLKYKQGYQDFQRDASNVTQYLTMGKCDNFSNSFPPTMKIVYMKS